MAPGKIQTSPKEQFANPRDHLLKLPIVLRVCLPGIRRTLEDQRQSARAKLSYIMAKLLLVFALQRIGHAVHIAEVQHLCGCARSSRISIKGQKIVANRGCLLWMLVDTKEAIRLQPFAITPLGML